MKLNESFNQELFLDWIGEFLPDFDRDVKAVDTPHSFRDVSSIVTLGESKIGVRVFVIKMNADPVRRRVTVAKDSFNILKSHSVQNAVIAYFCPDFGQWRLSLLTSTATWESGKVISKLSNLKRQSFVLGEGAKVKTPTKYLSGRVVDLLDLKKRFSIEVVNKDFYKEISGAFNSLQSVLQLPSKESKSQTNLEFSVRLIGRIIFCWFLREKRSEAGISLISNNVLSLGAAKDSADYYHKLLEPLFFEVLNKPLEGRNFDEFDKDPFTQTPYLNGGLFSAQYDDFYDRGRNDFQSKYHNTLVVPNSWFESFFETLETYHFTIDENTSYDEELSIDPEMLGRIFENLLAEINPDTGESARKSTGSYYTPRIIVDYMVDESLTQYLKNKTSIGEDKLRAVISYDLDDDQTNSLTQEEKEKIINALGKLKILDPACGSGAFPIGALQKIVFILQQVDPNAELMHEMDLRQTPSEFRRHIQEEYNAGNYDYLRKLRVIRESIYGVDIQPIATEISRLRCFLTLVVDQGIKDDRPDRGIKPLPNLDFKFVTANTLIGLPKNEKGVQQIGFYDDRERIESLKETIDDYFNSSGIEREQLKAKFANEQKSLLREMEKEHGWSNVQKAELSNKLIDWEPFSHKTADWFDPEWMFGIKEGFDIVIANPPYVSAVDSVRSGDTQRDSFRKKYKQLKGAFDLYVVFLLKGIELVNEKGTFVWIVPNKVMSSKYSESVLQFLKDNGLIKIVSISGTNAFESASVYPVLLVGNLASNDDFQVFEADSLDKLARHDFIERSEILNKYSTLEKENIQISSGTTGFQAQLIKEFISETKTVDSIPFVVSGCIDPYLVSYKDVRYMGNKYSQAYIVNNPQISNSKWNFWNQPKIVIAGMSKRVEAVYVDKPLALGVGIYGIYGFGKYSPKLLLALLNSSYYSYYLKTKFRDKHLAGGYLAINKSTIQELPLIDIDQETSNRLVSLVEKILSNTESTDYLDDEEKKVKVSQLQNQIDTLVYKLFDLSSEEIKNIEEAMQN